MRIRQLSYKFSQHHHTRLPQKMQLLIVDEQKAILLDEMQSFIVYCVERAEEEMLSTLCYTVYLSLLSECKCAWEMDREKSWRSEDEVKTFFFCMETFLLPHFSPETVQNDIFWKGQDKMCIYEGTTMNVASPFGRMAHAAFITEWLQSKRRSCSFPLHFTPFSRVHLNVIFPIWSLSRFFQLHETSSKLLFVHSQINIFSSGIHISPLWFALTCFRFISGNYKICVEDVSRLCPFILLHIYKRYRYSQYQIVSFFLFIAPKCSEWSVVVSICKVLLSVFHYGNQQWIVYYMFR